MNARCTPATGALLLLCTTVTAFSAPGDVGRTFDATCQYPAGLACDGRYFFVADWREERIHVISAEDGTPFKTQPAPTLKPHGLAHADGRLFVSDDHTGWIYVVDLETGTVVRSFEAPGSKPTGLAWTGDALFILERSSGQIYKVLPDDGTILGYFAAPTRSATCLTYDGQYLWAADRVKNELYWIDPATGTVIGILPAPGPYAAGLAWHDGKLWNVDFQTRKLYEITVTDDPPYRLSDTREARVEYLWTLYNYGPGEVRKLRAAFAIPDNLPQQTLLSPVRFAAPPTREVTDRWGQVCAVYELDKLTAGTRQPLGYNVDVRVAAIRYLIDPAHTGKLEDIPAEIRTAYTADADRYRITSPFIQETVRQVVGDERCPYWIARKIFNHLIAKLEYQMIGGWDVPEVVLKRGTGSCSEYTFAFIALCRAAGLPARYVGSIVVRGDDASVDEAFHRWAEVYLPNYGWIPVDANKGDTPLPADQCRGFGELDNRYLITTHGGGDSEWLAWGYNGHSRYQATGYCKLEEDHLGFWEPLRTADTPGSPPERPAVEPAKVGGN